MSISGGEEANGRTRKPRKRSPEFRFIDHDLTVEEKDELRALDLDTELSPMMVFDLVDAGFTVKLAPDKKGGGVRCHLMDSDVDGSGDTFCLSGRGSQAVNAWYAVAFRHYVLAQEDWSVFLRENRTDTDYG